MRSSTPFLASAFLLSLMPWDALAQSPGNTIEDVDAYLTANGFQLKWEDDFDGSALDPDKWGHRSLGKRLDADNRESQAFLDGEGHLVIETKIVEGDDGEPVVLSGMVGSMGRNEDRFGYFEATMQFPHTRGVRTAFWLQSHDIGKIIGDPARSGVEVDIAEHYFTPKEYLQHALHWDGYRRDHKSIKMPLYAFNTSGWMRIGVLWDCDGYTFFVNGKQSYVINNAVSLVPEYVIFSAEVPNAASLDQSSLPALFKVDSVKVYQKPDAADACILPD